MIRILLSMLSVQMMLCASARAEPLHDETFDAAWTLLAENFVDPGMKGLDWDAVKAELRPQAHSATDEPALARVLADLTGRLKTSHTDYLGPDDARLPILLDVYRGNPALTDLIKRRYGDRGPELVGIGIFTTEVDGKPFVDLVLSGSPAERAGLRVGDEIVAVDGKPFQSAASFIAPAGQSVELSVRRKTTAPVERVRVLVERSGALEALDGATRASVRVIERGDHKIAYVRFWSMARSIPEEIVQMLPLQDADALILDIRGIVGGGKPQLLDLLDVRNGRMCWRGRKSASCAPATFRGRTVLLTDHHTRSGAELLAYGFRKLAFGKIVGGRTAGAVSGGQLFPLPNNGALYIAVMALDVDGKVLEGTGVHPDIEVARPGPYASGQDNQLDEAVKAALSLSRKAKE